MCREVAATEGREDTSAVVEGKTFPGARQVGSTGSGKTSSTSKDYPSVFRSSMLLASLRSSYTSLPQFTGSHSFPINAPILTEDTLQD